MKKTEITPIIKLCPVWISARELREGYSMHKEKQKRLYLNISSLLVTVKEEPRRITIEYMYG